MSKWRAEILGENSQPIGITTVLAPDAQSAAEQAKRAHLSFFPHATITGVDVTPGKVWA